MGAINVEWHEQNLMPKNATEDERAQWHIAHLDHCPCRQPTPGVQDLIDRYRAEHAADGAEPGQ